MRILILAIAGALILSSCGFFVRKMNETMQEGNKQLQVQVDSLKRAVIMARQENKMDSVFAAKIDTLYESGFRLMDLADSIQVNNTYAESYQAELSFFRNYVNHNFEYSDQISSLMPMLDMGSKFNNQQMPMGLNGSMDIMYTVAKQSVMQIIIACQEQYKEPVV